MSGKSSPSSRDSPDPLARWQAAEAAVASGDMAGFRAALGDPAGFPDCLLGVDFLGCGDRPLDIAIRCGPPAFVAALIASGADPRAEAADGFPPLFQAIDAPREDRHAVLAVLLDAGADTEQRGLNDGTALHHAVARRDIAAVRMLLAHGADIAARTRIDDLSTPLEDAEAMGFAEAVALMRPAPSPPRRRR
ncbi:ankyrin repeat domain-containing protein [Neoroseomonas oryzicola]|uniref:Ankyrin repeat domain-containing protein n=2 Tax=Neoroseomonas oryzicola TaxID=535904 RepID=A0ABX1EEW5_9PROT|nr:ankyrin repeat domain-containing protein [Neoroseomonas oryzicola]NKE16032.1 ankyrin repeat domain-containing protein [Neoroseomonas oryzicola]